MSEKKECCPKCYAPGVWICDKCGFTQFKNVLFVQSGNIGVDTKPHLEPCPNDGRDMRPVTWKERCEDIAKVCEQQVERAVKAEERISALEAENAKFRNFIKQATRMNCDCGWEPHIENGHHENCGINLARLASALLEKKGTADNE